MKKISLFLIPAILLLLLGACTKEKTYAPVTPFLGFSNSGITALDDQVTVTVKLPNETQSVEASYFGKLAPVTLTEVTQDNNLIKTGSVVIKRTDLTAITKLGDRAYVWFKVNGDELNMSSTQVQLNTAMTADAPATVLQSDQEVQVKYAANPVVAASDLAYKVYILVKGKPATPYNPSFVEYTKPYSGGVIKIKGTDFNNNDTVSFKIVATARGLSDEITTKPFIVGGYTFQKTASVLMVNDSTADVTVDKKLLYVVDAAKIVNVPWTVTINGSKKIYSSITIQSSQDSSIVTSLRYLSVSGKDSFVYTKNPAKYMVVKTENYISTAEAYNFVGNGNVYKTDASADLIFNNALANKLTLGTGVTLISSKDDLGKKVDAVKAYAAIPPGTATVLTAGASFTPKPGDYYVVMVVRGSATSYSVVKFGAITTSSKLTGGDAPVVFTTSSQAFDVFYGENY